MVIDMDAIWFGGPFDGSAVSLREGATEFAVAYDINDQPIEGWEDLQNLCDDLPPAHHHPACTKVCIYRVAYPANTGFLFPVVLFRHVPKEVG